MKRDIEDATSISEADLEKLTKEANQEATPSAAKIMWREFVADKPALISLFILIAFILFVIIASMFIDVPKMMETNIMGYYAKPFTPEYWLGADAGGRSIAKELVVGYTYRSNNGSSVLFNRLNNSRTTRSTISSSG